MDYLLINDDPVKLYLMAAAVFLFFNSLCIFLLKLLLPWQTKRLLKKWKIQLKSVQKISLLRQLKKLVVNLSGTVSYGAPVVTDIYPNGISSANLLALAAAIEGKCAHPIAEAIVDEAKVRGLELPEITASNIVPGKGMEALMNRQSLSLGSASFFQEQNINVDAELLTKADQLAYKGNIIVFVAVSKFCRGFITLRDKVKRSIPGDVNFLREMGTETVVLTGTNRSTAKSYSKATNIESIRSELNNMEKVKEVLLMQTSGEVVGAAGRNTNFINAAQTADISFALEYAEGPMKRAADVLIHTTNLATIATAKGICRAAYGTQKTGWLICAVSNLLLGLAVAYLCSLGTLPSYSAFFPIVIGIIGVVLMFLNQIPLKY